MKLHLNNRPDCKLVQSCVADGGGVVDGVVDGGGDGGGGGIVDAGGDSPARHRFFIDGVWHRHSVILTPAAVTVWEVAAVAELTARHFERLADLGAEVVLLGTGARLTFVPAALTQALMRRRIGLEVMDTPAACRTYNILAGDGREVAAGLIA